MIQTINQYEIKINGELDMADLNTQGPLRVELYRIEKDISSFSVHTDQSGLIGLLRHLHGQGFVLLSIRRLDNENHEGEKQYD